MNAVSDSRNSGIRLGAARESEKATNGLVSFELRTAIVCREKLKDRGTKGNRRD